MGEAAAVRWRKYGKDRLYVNAADGTRLGWRDLLTGADELEPGAPADVYHAAVTAWMDERPALRPPEITRQRTPTASEEDSPAGERVSASTADNGPIPSVPAVDAARDVSVGKAPSAPATDAAVVDRTGRTAMAEQAAQPSSPARSDEHDLELLATLVAAHEPVIASAIRSRESCGMSLQGPVRNAGWNTHSSTSRKAAPTNIDGNLGPRSGSPPLARITGSSRWTGELTSAAPS